MRGELGRSETELEAIEEAEQRTKARVTPDLILKRKPPGMKAPEPLDPRSILW
jgi:hypothetical protein